MHYDLKRKVCINRLQTKLLTFHIFKTSKVCIKFFKTETKLMKKILRGCFYFSFHHAEKNNISMHQRKIYKECLTSFLIHVQICALCDLKKTNFIE